MAEMAGLHRRLQPGFAVGYGYTAIIIAWLARLHPLAIIFVSFLFGALFRWGKFANSHAPTAIKCSDIAGIDIVFLARRNFSGITV